jgi:hypothetical protein
VVREAIEKHCDAVLGTSLLEQMADYIGAFDSGVGGQADRTGEAFKDLLMERHRRQSVADDPD